MGNQYEARYETKLVELKYIEPIKSGGTWNIFEKHRGKRVVNLPNQLGCNPDLVLKSELDSERTARLEAEKQIKTLEEKLKLIDHDNQKQCPMCEAETLTEDQKTVLSGVEVTAKIRKCSKCDFSWLPPSEESRIELVARKTLEARLAKCKEQRNEYIIDCYEPINHANLVINEDDQELEQITGGVE